MAQLPKKNSKLKRNNYLIYRQTKPPGGGGKDINMDWSMASACAAWVGAITGIGNTTFSLVKYFKSKPRAKITLSDQYSSYILSSRYIYDVNSKPKEHTYGNGFKNAAISFRIINSGKMPLIIDHMRVFMFDSGTWSNFNPTYEYNYQGMNLIDKKTKRLSTLVLKLAPLGKFPIKVEPYSAKDFQYVGVGDSCLNKRNEIKVKIYFSNKEKTSILKIPVLRNRLDSDGYKLL